MNDRAGILAMRKELLLARSSLCRLKIRGEVEGIRSHLSWARAGVAIAGAVPVRAFAFSLALGALGRGRLARFVRLAGRALVVARLATVAVALFRTPPEEPGARAVRDAAPHP